MDYPHLFQEFKLGPTTLKNRLVMSPMTMNYATQDGLATDKLIRHYLERAKGGVGLIIVEGTYFTQEGKGYVNQLGLVSDEHARKLRKLTEAVHGLKNRVKIFIQIHHAGWRAYSKVTGLQPVGPSAIPPYPGAETPRVLSKGDIKGIVEAHIEAAGRAREAGFDGVDIHCAHGYLIPSFLSPLSNQRNDEYGGDITGRIRLLLEIVHGIKERNGKDFSLTIKICGDEYIEGGLNLHEMIEIAKRGEAAGIDGIMISAGTVGGKKAETLDDAHRALRTLPMMTEPGCLVPLATEMKKNLKIPVIAVGRINQPALAEEIIAQGKADLAAMGRPLLADPYLPQKAQEGKEALIRPCIACNEGCYKRIFQQLDIQCGTNPTVGRDEEIFCEKTSDPKQVVVVGAGPAGLEAAHAAWETGHRVVLMEKSKSLGGQLNLASLPPGRKDIERFQQFLLTRLETTDIQLATGMDATPEAVQQYQPDFVICSAGANPQRIDIPGLENVQTTDGWQIIAGETNFNGPFLVLGGGLIGCEAADHLSDQGETVTLVEMLPEIATEGDGDTKTFYSIKFQKQNVAVYTGATLQSIQNKFAVIDRNGEEVRIPVETVVLAVGAEPNQAVCDRLKSLELPMKTVGDCIAPRRILEAIHEGFQAGRAV
jgi:2,4-dienoyl-CoA reductase-like NADH-dependent reductase (Old Yellow Enzyme family)/thioredoxin reductase